MLGIIGAMDEEVAMIKAQLTDVQVETRAAMDFYKGKLEGKEVVVVRSGIGKVNAAMCTQILADIYGVTGVVNTGIAGSLKAEIDIGDIVLSSDAVQHDMGGETPGSVSQTRTTRIWPPTQRCCRRKRSTIRRRTLCPLPPAVCPAWRRCWWSWWLQVPPC